MKLNEWTSMGDGRWATVIHIIIVICYCTISWLIRIYQGIRYKEGNINENQLIFKM